MKKICCLFLLVHVVSVGNAQYKVKFILKEQTFIHHDSIYVTGNFRNWDSVANNNYLLQPAASKTKQLTVTVNAGPLRYKFQRGSWLKVEKTFYGLEVNDRVVNINRDTTLTDSVSAWRDEIKLDKWVGLGVEKTDTGRMVLLFGLANMYAFVSEYYNADSALYYAQSALNIIQKIKTSDEYRASSPPGHSLQLMTMRVQETMLGIFHSLGNYPKSLELGLENLSLAERENLMPFRLASMIDIAQDYLAMKDYQTALKYCNQSELLLNNWQAGNSHFNYIHRDIYYYSATAFLKLHQLDSALYFEKKGSSIDSIIGDLAFDYLLFADIYSALGNIDSAFKYYRLSIPSAGSVNATHLIVRANAGIAGLFKNQGKTDSALHYATVAFKYLESHKANIQAWGESSNNYMADLSPVIAELYKDKNQLDSAYKYLHLSVTLKDSLYNVDKIRQFQTFAFNETTRRQQLAEKSREAEQEYQTKIKQDVFITILLAVLAVASILYRSNKQKQKANMLLRTQKNEIEKTLGELKATQTQLIQSEKMASLGELTAGIAHEIQNPLNFVNNFSEVSNELIDEMKAELASGNYEEAVSIADDVKQNLEKINQHGKRADAIVKGMLQHSRKSTGHKEPTDINALAAEYLRLSYHGLRAKDKSFNAEIKTDFDESIEKINIIPQEMGRVLLNLLNNAFYATSERQKAGGEGFGPVVSVSTKLSGDKVDIRVADNGAGIPQKIVNKIFQPFFTTKPTGEGTGLGLSLSYDIIKAHGGEIKVETNEGVGTEFIVTLPIR